jgi:galactose mutarotase-like enzyme
VTTLTAGPAMARVDRARGGRLASLQVRGHELLVQPDPDEPYDPLLWGCFPMVPFAGRVRGGRFRWHGVLHELAVTHAGHAMHGTLFDQRWMVEQADQRYVRLRARLESGGWPFPGAAVHEIGLYPDRIELRLEVHADDAPFPATSGWHPWFVRHLGVGEPLEVDLRAARYYPRGSDGLPLGSIEPPPASGPWDDCFTAVTWPVRLTWAGALEVAMTSTCSHVVLYDEQPHAICVEPQSGPPDAPNLGRAHIVRPVSPLVIETQLTWSVP